MQRVDSFQCEYKKFKRNRNKKKKTYYSYPMTVIEKK